MQPAMSDAAMTQRPEIYRETWAPISSASSQKPLTSFETLYNQGWLRKLFVLVVLAALWEGYAPLARQRTAGPDLHARPCRRCGAGSSAARCSRARLVVDQGAADRLQRRRRCSRPLLTFLAINTRIGTDFLETMTAMFNPLPAIALLPLALIWFGLGIGSLVFVLIHSVLWAVALNTHAGFRGVSNTYRMVGQQLRAGRSALRRQDPDPGGVPEHPRRPQDRLGLRLAHADRGRTGVRRRPRGRAGSAGSSSRPRTSSTFPTCSPGLLTIILIGLAVENVIFRLVEQATVRRWGMQD